MERVECLLDNPDLDIVTEVDHRVGLCLCSKCSCGLHKCTNKSFFSSSKAKVCSSYSQNYKKPKNPVLSIPTSRRAIAPTQPFLAITTSQSEFKPFPIIYTVEKLNPQRSSHSPFKLQQITSYAKDFLNFGVIKSSPYTAQPTSYKINTKFEETTTYKTSFQGKNSLISRSVSANKFKALPNISFIGESSQKRDYCYKAPLDLPVAPKLIQNEPSVRHVSPTSFITSNMKSFQHLTNTKISIGRSSHKKPTTFYS